jgi:hypothetical protein
MTTTMTVPRHRKIKWLGVVAFACFVIAFVLRLLWILKFQSPHSAVYSDMNGYVTRADELLGNIPPSLDPRTNTFYPYGTHYLIAGELALVGRKSEIGVAIIHALVGALPVPCVVYITSRLVPKHGGYALIMGGFAGLVAALWHPQITYVGFFMSEIWFTAACLISAAFFVRQSEKRVGRFASALFAGVAAAAAFVIRPQFTFTVGLVFLFAYVLRLRETLTDPVKRKKMIAIALPIVLAIGFSAYRFHHITGRWALISDNGPLMRLFGETEVGFVECWWPTPAGTQYGAWYGAALRKPFTERNTFKFTGYQGDETILNHEREERLSKMSWRARLGLASFNVKSLVLSNFPNPEGDFHGNITRLKLARVYRKILYWLLGLGLLGLFAMRRAWRPEATIIVVANLMTVVTLPLIFYTEARYRVPYDPFIIIAAAVGIGTVLRWLFWARDRLTR